MTHYTYLSEANLSMKSAKPITTDSLEVQTNKKTFLSRLFGSSNKKVKPITISKEQYAEEYYRKYGIIYTGSDLGSCINSLFT